MNRSEPTARVSAGTRKFLCVLSFVVASLVACWPALVNGQPFLLSDTMTYVRGADAAIVRLTGLGSEWSGRYQQRFSNTIANVAAPAAAENRPVIISGRSIYYGTFLFAAEMAGGFWIAALLQAFLVVACLYGTIVRFSRRHQGSLTQLLLIVSILSLTTGLAYFDAYMVPDIFTGLGVLAAAHLAASIPPLSRCAKLLWLFVLCVCALAHSSNILVIACLLFALFAGWLIWKRPAASNVLTIGIALAVGISGEVAFNQAVKRQFGDPPVRPPFLMARLIADGPGRLYLQKNCPQSRFVLCRHTKEISRYNHYAYSDAFLWSPNNSDGVFSAVDFRERRAIAREESRFVAAVALDRPLEILRSSSNTIGLQALRWKLREFNVDPTQRAEFASQLPPRVMRAQATTLAFHSQMPVAVVEALAFPVAFLSLAVMGWAMATRTLGRDFRIFIAVLLFGATANVLVCGALSTPHDRYLMRAAWLLPLGAYLCFSRILQQKRDGALPSHNTLTASL